MFLKYEYGGNIYKVEVERDGEKYYITHDDNMYTVTAVEIDKGFLQIDLADRQIKCVVSEADESKYVFIDGEVLEVVPIELTGRKKGKGGGESEKDLRSPISGKVVKVEVAKGDQVKTDDVLMVIEAMKMEYIIKAPWDGVVEKVEYSEGEQIEIGEETMDIKKEE